jgi:hypothetical protein
VIRAEHAGKFAHFVSGVRTARHTPERNERTGPAIQPQARIYIIRRDVVGAGPARERVTQNGAPPRFRAVRVHFDPRRILGA